MNLTCRDVDELVGPLALDALTPGDRLDVLEHLADCRKHDEELQAFRVTAGQLVATSAPINPPERLKTSLLAAFDAEKVASASPEEAVPAPAQPLRLPFWRKPDFAYGVAAALVLVIIGLAAWNFSLQDNSTSGETLLASAAADGASFNAVYLPGEQLVVMAANLPSLPSGQTYQAWQITDGGPVSLGLLAGTPTQVMEADLSDATAIAISVESAGGSTAPTSAPLLVATLNR